MKNKELDRKWKLEIGSKDKVILILPRKDSEPLDFLEWEEVLKPFLHEFKFIILDFPEKITQENNFETDFTVEELAKYLSDYLVNNNIIPDMIWGISLGGMIAQHLLTFKEFELIPTLLISTMLFPNKKLKAVFSTWYLLVDQFGESGLKIGLSPWIKKETELPITNISLPQIQQNSLSLSKAKASLKAILQHDSREKTESIIAPIEVIFGKESVLLCEEESEPFTLHIPHSKIHFIQNSGMRVFEENPNEVNEIIRTFISKYVLVKSKHSN